MPLAGLHRRSPSFTHRLSSVSSVERATLMSCRDQVIQDAALGDLFRLLVLDAIDALGSLLGVGQNIGEGAGQRRGDHVIFAAERDVSRLGQFDVELVRGRLEAGERLDLADGRP